MNSLRFNASKKRISKMLMRMSSTDMIEYINENVNFHIRTQCEIKIFPIYFEVRRKEKLVFYRKCIAHRLQKTIILISHNVVFVI